MHITKMQGLGNDYLYVFGDVPENIIELSTRLSDRHFGIGSDGMIFISRSDRADFSMRIFNADGSEALMCGNGIRCVGKYLYDKGYTEKEELRIETASGIRDVHLHINGGKVSSVSVDMGSPSVGDTLYVTAAGREYSPVPVSVGNPHAVIFTEDANAVPLAKAGSEIERSGAFPGGVNVEFVSLVREGTLRMRVWERGSGITLACGTGACASAAAAWDRGICDKEKPVRVILDGGELEIELRGNSLVMTGGCEFVVECDTPH